MSKLMMALGVALAAVGLMLGLVGLTYPSKLVEHSIELSNATLLVVGGILSFGLGGVLDALHKLASHRHSEMQAQDVMPSIFRPSAPVEVPPAVDEPAVRPPFMGLGRKPSEAAAGAMAAGAAVTAVAAETVEQKVESISPSVAETINALEQAKSDIRVALGVGNPQPQAPVSSVAIPPPHDMGDEEEVIPPPAEPAQEAAADVEAEVEPEELFVVEEKLIRGRPARILSDGTVEAETEEGWMRFENLEHLNEYLDG